MGHKLSKEFLDPSVTEVVEEFVGDITQLETADRSSIVAALNEIFDNQDWKGKFVNLEYTTTKGFRDKLTEMGIYSTVTDTFDQLLAKLDEIYIVDEYEAGEGTIIFDKTAAPGSTSAANTTRQELNYLTSDKSPATMFDMIAALKGSVRFSCKLNATFYTTGSNQYVKLRHIRGNEILFEKDLLGTSGTNVDIDTNIDIKDILPGDRLKVVASVASNSNTVRIHSMKITGNKLPRRVTKPAGVQKFTKIVKSDNVLYENNDITACELIKDFPIAVKEMTMFAEGSCKVKFTDKKGYHAGAGWSGSAAVYYIRLIRNGVAVETSSPFTGPQDYSSKEFDMDYEFDNIKVGDTIQLQVHWNSTNNPQSAFVVCKLYADYVDPPMSGNGIGTTTLVASDNIFKEYNMYGYADNVLTSEINMADVELALSWYSHHVDFAMFNGSVNYVVRHKNNRYIDATSKGMEVRMKVVRNGETVYTSPATYYQSGEYETTFLLENIEVGDALCFQCGRASIDYEAHVLKVTYKADLVQVNDYTQIVASDTNVIFNTGKLDRMDYDPAQTNFRTVYELFVPAQGSIRTVTKMSVSSSYFSYFDMKTMLVRKGNIIWESDIFTFGTGQNYTMDVTVDDIEVGDVIRVILKLQNNEQYLLDGEILFYGEYTNSPKKVPGAAYYEKNLTLTQNGTTTVNINDPGVKIKEVIVVLSHQGGAGVARYMDLEKILVSSKTPPRLYYQYESGDQQNTVITINNITQNSFDIVQSIEDAYSTYRLNLLGYYLITDDNIPSEGEVILKVASGTIPNHTYASGASRPDKLTVNMNLDFDPAVVVVYLPDSFIGGGYDYNYSRGNVMVNSKMNDTYSNGYICVNGDTSIMYIDAVTKASFSLNRYEKNDATFDYKCALNGAKWYAYSEDIFPN